MAMSLHNRHCAVMGLGVTGWSCVRFLAPLAGSVRVYDSRGEPPFADELQQRFPTLDLVAGELPDVLPEAVDLVVVSPGVGADLPCLQDARRRGVEVIGDIELFARFETRPVIGITGSNGKSTVTALVAEMLREDRREVAVGGNFGTPALDLLAAEADIVVLELSSFQLELTSRLPCICAAVLNISADHIDRHGSVDAYAQAKARIFRHAETAIINADDGTVVAMIESDARHEKFSVSGQTDARFRLSAGSEGDVLTIDGEPLAAVSDLVLVGRHNYENALAALAIAGQAKVAPDAMKTALMRFSGLPHRCERIADRHGVRWINDSKGTNIGAAVAAIEGFDGSIVWLGGGIAKDENFAPLRQALSSKGRAAVLFGRDAELIQQGIAGALPVFMEDSLDDSVRRADAVAEPGDTVLLSPACASFDQFSGFEERGRRFVEAVRGLSA